MKKWALILGALVVTAASTPARAAFNDGTFEATSIGSNSYVYNPSSAFYTFAGNSGLTSGTNAFTNPTTSGQVAFIQRNPNQGAGITGSISQSFTLDAGTYALSFQTANRANYGQSVLSVSLDGVNIALITPTTTTFATTALNVALTGSSHILTFTAAGPAGQDTTTFLDNIAFSPTAVPEPASVAMLGMGLAAAGLAARRSRRTA